MDAVRQAAILVAALDMESADALLDQMPEEFAAAVRTCIMELDEIDPAEEQAIIGQFLGKENAVANDKLDLSSDLVDTAGAVTLEEFLTDANHQRSFPNGSADLSPHGDAEKASVLPFSFLDGEDGSALLAILQQEHPQTIAVVLSHIDSAQAASVLASLSEETQVDVARRMAVLEEVDVQTLREIESALHIRTRSGAHQPKGQVGWKAIQKIVATSDEAGSDILQNLRRADEKLANKLMIAQRDSKAEWETDSFPEQSQRIRANSSPAPHVEFEDLAKLSDADLGKVLQRADGRTLLLALAGATPIFINRVYRQLPAGDAKALRRQIEQQGTIRLRDVEEAQRRISLVAGMLAIESTIDLPVARRLAVAA